MGLGPEPSIAMNTESEEHQSSRMHTFSGMAERLAESVFLLPSVLALLFLSIFPLIASLYVSLSRFRIAKGGFTLTFVGLENYKKLFLGTDRTHFLGAFAPSTLLTWVIFGAAVIALAIFLARYILNARVFIGGLIGRILLTLGLGALTWMFVHTLWNGGRLGSVSVTIVYVFVGIFFQYILGLGMAMLTIQRLPGRRFFRVVFLLPMTITPVGVAYMFRMLTDTGKGPFVPLFDLAGLQNFAWVNDPWGARIAVMVGDIWQWTPFMFIVLLAALEGQDQEITEAALVDGANRRQVFRHITLPALLPVTTTVILIRMIEAFKIIDLPNILTNGGPGTATESLTLEAFFDWRTLNLGRSAALAYMLLIVVTLIATAYVNLVRRRVTATA